MRRILPSIFKFFAKAFSLSFFLLIGVYSHSQILTSSNLPIVIINTDIDSNSGVPLEIIDENRVGADMKIIFRPEGTRNFLTDENNSNFLNYNGRISIELRGSSSQFLEKKPYALTTLQANNVSNNNVSLLEMPEENDWILNPLAFDQSLMRDNLSYDLARSIGSYAARTQYCEVMVNGDYRGVYMLSEKIKVDAERVNIVKMTETDTALPQLSGGYITKCDKTTGGDPVAWSFETFIGNEVNFIHDTPNPTSVTIEQNDYIFNIFDSLETIASNQNSSIENGYPSVIDVPTFVDFIILNEIASNVDGYQLSSYFHKDRNGKLRAGPIWDFNLTYGLDVFGDRSQTNVWQFNNGDNVGAKFWRNLFVNPTFKCYLKRRWISDTATGMPLNLNTIFSKLDSYATKLAEAAVREQTRWGSVPDFLNSVQDIKTWLTARYQWLADNLGAIGNCSFPNPARLVISKINYNPISNGTFTSNQLEFLEITNNSNSSVNISGYYFKELGITYIFPNGSAIGPQEKIYLVSNATAFLQVYGAPVFGVFSRNLSNKSELLVLADPFGNVADSVNYSDQLPWPMAADGGGSYLTLLNIDSDNSLATSWTASSQSLSTSDLTLAENIAVYPNPTADLLRINSPFAKIVAWEITDLSGRILQTKTATRAYEEELSLASLSKQTYFLRISLENGEKIWRKIIKQ